MGTTAKRLINQAASKIGVKGRGMDLQPDELMDWLVGFKQMIDGWALEELMIPFVSRETFQLSEQQSFTIGPGGDFDTERPLEIRSLQIFDEANENYDVPLVPLKVHNLTTDDVSGRPRRAYYENGYPLATLFFDRIPYDPRLEMVSLKPISVWQVGEQSFDPTPTFSGQHVPTSALGLENLLADIEFDRGYEGAIVFNLALYMAPDYEKQPSPLVIQMADMYKTRIKNQNIVVPDAMLDGGLSRGQGYYDIEGGP